MTTIILTRHGHVEGISPERFRGRAEIPLSEQGVIQAEMTAAHIAARWKPHALFTSEMGRCVATGQTIAERCGLQSVAIRELTDLDYGEWQWKTYEEVRTTSPLLFARWFEAPHLVRFPAGEALQDIVLRSADALRRVIENFPDRTVVLVGHDSVNRALLMQVLDQPLSAYWRLSQAPCNITLIEASRGVFHVRTLNDVSHLERSGS